MSIESRLVAAQATAVVDRLAKRVIAQLQRLKDCRLSGDGSVLDNTWDEICVQLQEEESLYWDAYVDTTHAFALAEVNTLSHLERQAIWLQTENGWRWLDGPDSDEDSPQIPVDPDDVAGYIVQEVLDRAAVWSNWRIRQFLAR